VIFVLRLPTVIAVHAATDPPHARRTNPIRCDYGGVLQIA
jgi:hypothetical protein